MADIEEIKCSFPGGGNSSPFNDLEAWPKSVLAKGTYPSTPLRMKLNSFMVSGVEPCIQPLWDFSARLLVQVMDARLLGHDNIEVLPEMENQDLTRLEK